MYHKFYTKQFKKSVRKIIRSGRIGRDEIEKVIDILAGGNKLPEKFRDHMLSGAYAGYKECHIRPDLLLIYKIENKALVLVLSDIGSHSEIF